MTTRVVFLPPMVSIVRMLVPMKHNASMTIVVATTPPTVAAVPSITRRRRWRRGWSSLLPWYLLHIGLIVLGATTTTATTTAAGANSISDDDNRNNTGSDPLLHWLDQLTIDIPDQSYKKGLIHLRIYQLSCTHFITQRLYSHIGTTPTDDDTNTNDDTISLITNGVGASCQGRYDASGMTGVVTVQLGGKNHDIAGSENKKKRQHDGEASSVVDEPDQEEEPEDDFLWTFALLDEDDTTTADRRDDIFPNRIVTVNCVVRVQVIDLRFDGSWSAKLIDLFRREISDEINREISSETICPQLSTTIDPMVSEYIHYFVDHYVKPYNYHHDVVFATNTSNEDDDDDDATDDTITGTAGATNSIRSSSTARYLEDSMLWKSLALAGDDDDDDDDDNTIVFTRDLPVMTNLLTSVNTILRDHLHHGILFDTECDLGLDGGVNGLMRRHVSQISWSFPLALQYRFGNATVIVHLQNWTVAGPGLHEWQSLELLVPPPITTPATTREPKENRPGQSFPSRMQTSNLDVSVDATITVLTTPTAEPLLESFTVMLNLADIDLSASVLLRLDRAEFIHNVTAGDVIDGILFGLIPASSGGGSNDSNLSDALACLVTPIKDLRLTDLSPRVNVSSVALRSTTADDQLEQDLDAVINDIVSGLLLKRYGTLISKTIMGYSRGPVQDKVNTFLTNQIDNIQHSGTNCTHNTSQQQQPTKPHSWIDFTTIAPLRQVNAFLHDPTTLARINTYMDCAASTIGKIIQDKLVEYPSSSLVVLDEFKFDHFGSFEQLNAFRPINTSTLQTSFSIGGDHGRYPHVTVNVSVPAVNGEMSASMALSNLTWSSSAMILYDQAVLRRSSMQELLSQGHCLLAPMYSLNLVDFEGSFGRFELNATMSVEVHNRSYEIHFSSTDFPEIQDYVWTIFGWSIASLRQAVSAIAATTVNNAQQTCVPSSKEKRSNNNYNNSSSTSNETGGDSKLTAHALWVILGTLFIMLQPLILLFRRERNIRNEHVASDERQLFEPLLGRHPTARSQEPVVVVQRAQSLSLMQRFESHTVHYALPVMVVLTVVLFLASNCSTGATVDLAVSVGPSQHFAVPGVYSFGLIDTAKNMLSAGIYPLFLLVVVFSGIWPYAKLLFMFSAWVAPSNILSVKRREKLLTTLDACSKYSLVDTYVFIVMLVAFRYHLQLDTPVDDFAFDAFVAPLFGFYGFLIATTLSLVLGHVMIYYHRRDALHETLNAWSSEESVNVLTHRFKLRSGRRCHISKACAGVLAATFIATVVLLSLGMIKESFSFDFGGVAGYLLGETKSRIDYSVLSLWQAIPASINGGGIAAKLLQAAFFFYTIVTPFVSLLLLAMLVTCPLTLPGQVKLLSVAEIANSWSALEVFVLSILAALFEISTFSNFIVGDKCYLINEITAKYTELHDPSCFNVTCSIKWEALYLITGTILLSFWSTTILRLTRTCIVERITVATSIENDDEWSLLAWMAERVSWLVVDGDLPTVDDGEVLPVIADDTIRTPSWVENPSDSGAWEATAREDPSWREWQNTTNVT